MTIYSKSIFSFPRQPTTRPWWRYLEINDDLIYLLGNVCETCESFFHRLSNAELPIAPSELSRRLGDGINNLTDEIIDTISLILPEGDFVVGILRVAPSRMRTNPRKFSRRGDRRYSPKHYWGQDSRIDNDTVLHESILPLVSQAQLIKSRIKYYQSQIRSRSIPTALALSIADVRCVSQRQLDWKLIHFLIDGHHKIEAASRLRKEITLLSFLSVSESLARSQHTKKIVKHRYY